MIAHATKLSVASLAVVLALTVEVRAQEPLAMARELYASAAYEDALRVLDGPAAGKYALEQRQEVDLYRALCLFAMGRQTDAERAVETLIASDPLYRPADDMAPRIRTAITTARRRMLPGIIQQQYADAKNAFEKQDFMAAASGFKRVVDSLNDPDITQAASAPPLADLRILAAGFQDLSTKAIPPPPPPAPVAPPTPTPPPVNLATKIFTGEGGEKVTPPQPIRQDFPQFPGARPGNVSGVIEVIINAVGRVESAAMVEPITPVYDRMVQMATSNWLYQPAMVNGTPVKFRKRIRIAVGPSEPEFR